MLFTPLCTHSLPTLYEKFLKKSIDKNKLNGYNDNRKSHPMTVMLSVE